jgi:hypothetical protein
MQRVYTLRTQSECAGREKARQKENANDDAIARIARISIVAAVLIAILPGCSAQTATHKKKAPPKPEPTAQELFEYIRGALLSLSPEDGINDNLEVNVRCSDGRTDGDAAGRPLR